MAVIVALLVIAIVLMMAVAYIRAARRDARSVKDYRSTMDHLEHLTQKGTAYGGEDLAPPHVRVVPDVVETAGSHMSPPTPAPAPTPTPAPAPAPGGPGPAPTDPLVFLDDAVSDRAVSDWGPPAPPAPSIPVGPSPGSKRLRRRRRLRIGAAVASVAVVVAAVSVAVAVETGGHGHRAKTASTTPPSTATTGRTVAPVPVPPTTVASPAVVAVSRQPSAAVYQVNSGSVSVSLLSSGRCWIQVRSRSALGPIMFESIVVPGAQKNFGDTAGLWLRLGNPAAVQIRVDGTVLALPAVANPFDLTVEVAPANPT